MFCMNTLNGFVSNILTYWFSHDHYSFIYTAKANMKLHSKGNETVLTNCLTHKLVRSAQYSKCYLPSIFNYMSKFSNFHTLNKNSYVSQGSNRMIQLPGKAAGIGNPVHLGVLLQRVKHSGGSISCNNNYHTMIIVDDIFKLIFMCRYCCIDINISFKVFRNSAIHKSVFGSDNIWAPKRR